MLITEEYRAQNAALHAESEVYGVSGSVWASRIRDVCAALQTHDLLDYGCGKGTLQQGLSWKIHQYDPAVPEFSAPPEPHDVVACCDVLEHIEPECLEDVLDDLQRLIKKAGFFIIANRPAAKTLPDGRNAHLIQEGPDFWLPRLLARWHISLFHEVIAAGRVAGYAVVVRAK